MTKSTWFARTSALLFLAANSIVGIAGCSDDDDSSGPGGGGAVATYPRSVTVEYKVTSTTGLAEAAIIYENESGGKTVEDALPIPFTKTFTRTVNQYDQLGLSVQAPVGGSATAEILVDGKSVDSKTFSGSSIISGTVIHIFP